MSLMADLLKLDFDSPGPEEPALSKSNPPPRAMAVAGRGRCVGV